jgi:hypothetical protein
MQLGPFGASIIEVFVQSITKVVSDANVIVVVFQFEYIQPFSLGVGWKQHGCRC